MDFCRRISREDILHSEKGLFPTLFFCDPTCALYVPIHVMLLCIVSSLQYLSAFTKHLFYEHAAIKADKVLVPPKTSVVASKSSTQ